MIPPPVRIINLERRPDRATAVGRELASHGVWDFELVKAVDGRDLAATEDICRLFGGNDFGSRRGFMACALSHYRLWQHLAGSGGGHEAALILEDDVELTNDFLAKYHRVLRALSNNLSAPWDVVYLGFSMHERTRDKHRDIYDNRRAVPSLHRYRVDRSIGGLFAYLLHRRGARKLVDFIAGNGIKHGIDYLPIAYGDTMGLIQLETRPHLAFSSCCFSVDSDVDSDIQIDWDVLPLD